MIVEDSTFDFQPTPSSTTPGDIKFDNRYGFDGDINIGYDLGMFRLEAEGAYKHGTIDHFVTGGASFPTSSGSVTPGAYDVHGSTSALSFMVNGMLDFGDDDGLSGFVGGGVGVARVSYNNVRVFSNQAGVLDDSDSRFAWQILAGVRQSVSSNIDITLKYRFFNVGSVGFEGETGLPIDSGKFQSHSLLGGITFNFGAPPPPPPPVQQRP